MRLVFDVHRSKTLLRFMQSCGGESNSGSAAHGNGMDLIVNENWNGFVTF